MTMPGFHGSAWLNSEPLEPAGLRGHVVLVDFWTLTCINWLRTAPWRRAWWRAYRDDGLVVVGVHTPEFSFEHDVDLVALAVKEREIDYPVVIDNDYAVWTDFDNHFWPALYFVGTDGVIRDSHFGEGRFEESDRLLQRMLGIDREPVRAEGSGVEAAADWAHLRTPETYLGYARSEHFGSPDAVLGRPHVYEFPRYLHFNHWALAGEWAIEQERIVLHRAGGILAFRFQARDVHLVLSSPGPAPFRVRLDGAPPGAAHGVDVDEQGRGTLREGRLYQLIREPGEVRERTIEITFLEPGAAAYVFTFG